MVIPVFRKIFIIGFYRANSGMFLLALMFLFGMMRVSDHVLIATFFLSDSLLLLIPLGIGLLYNMNVISFYYKTLQLKENNFLGLTMLLEPRQKFLVSLYVQLIIFLPLVVYAVFLGVVAVMNGLPERIPMIMLALCLLFFVNVIYFRYLMNKPYHQQNIAWLKFRTFSFPGIRLYYPYHYFKYMIRADAVKMLLSKFLSVITLLVTFYIFNSEDYRISLITIGSLFSVAFNGLLVYGMHDFYENQYRITRNLPYRIINRFLIHAWILVIMILPECFAILRNFGSLGIGRTLLLMAFYFGIVILIKSLMLIRSLEPESYLKYAGYGFILLTFILLYRPPLLLLATLPVFVSALLYNYYYYKYEPVIRRSEALP